MAKRYFERHGRGVYTCDVCERRTRDTGDGVNHLCHECFEIAGWDNTINDNGYKPGTKDYATYRAECDILLAKAVKLGGNGERIKECNTYVWPEEEKGAA